MMSHTFYNNFYRNISTSIISSVIELAYETYAYALKNNNKKAVENDLSTDYCDIDYYRKFSEVLDIKNATNIVITLTDETVKSQLGFSVIDIFNDRIDFCVEVLDAPIISIPCNQTIEIDSGYIFQLVTQFPNFLLNLEDILLLQKISNKLDSEI